VCRRARLPGKKRTRGGAAAGGRIRAMPPAAAAALFGPLHPWLCVPSLESVRESVHGDLAAMMGAVVQEIARYGLRLDEPSALAGALLGDSAARPALEDACAALRAAEAAVTNATAPARRAAGAAAQRVRTATQRVRQVVGGRKAAASSALPTQPAPDGRWAAPHLKDGREQTTAGR
jgi:hypothetical protein